MAAGYGIARARDDRIAVPRSVASAALLTLALLDLALTPHVVLELVLEARPEHAESRDEGVELVQRVDASLARSPRRNRDSPACSSRRSRASCAARSSQGSRRSRRRRNTGSRRRSHSLVSSTYATTYAPAWKPGRFRNQRSLTRARYGMPMLSSFPLSIDPMRGPTYLGRRWTLRCSSVTLSTSILLSSISVGMEPNQDSAVPGRSASATPGGQTPGSGTRIALPDPGMCHAAASSASGRAPRVQRLDRGAQSGLAIGAVRPPRGRHAVGPGEQRAAGRMPSARAPIRSRRSDDERRRAPGVRRGLLPGRALRAR